MFDSLRQDVRHGARMLLKNPGFSLVSILSIGVGVAVSAAMFSVADGMVMRPLPVPRASEVMVIGGTSPDNQGFDTPLSYRAYLDVRDQARSFTGISAHRVLVTSFARRREDQTESRLGFAVSGNLFDVLEVRPTVGRFFRADEDQVANRDKVVVISHDTWVQQFQSDPNVAGKTLRLGGVEFTVIGVAPASFKGLELVLPGAFYVPLSMIPALTPGGAVNILEERQTRMLGTLLARLRSGVTLDQARAEIRQIGMALERAHPETEKGRGLVLRTHLESRRIQRGPATAVVQMLLVMALAVMVVACANVAGLLTSRAPARAREIAVRLAMGAGRVRLVRQLITETLLIAIGGGAVGVALAYGGIGLLQARDIVTDIGVRVDFLVERRVLAVAILMAAASTLFAGLVPAWRAARLGDLSGTLRNGAESAGRISRLWGRHALVASQVALALTLVTVGMFLYRAFNSELQRGPGFRTDHVLLVNIDPGLSQYDGPRAERFYDQLKDRVRGFSGVASVALSNFIPLNQDNRDGMGVVPEGFSLPPGTDAVRVQMARVDEGYFDTMRVRLVSGRGFLRSDTDETPRVAVINQTMASRFWSGQDAIGRRFRMQDGTWAQVVGIAADGKYNFITEGATAFFFVSSRQNATIRATLLVATPGDSAALAAPIRAAIQELDRDVPVTGTWTMERFYQGNAVAMSNLLTSVVGSISVVGLGLAMVGLYGLMAYAVSRRTREIGIRMAIGAMPGTVLGMVMRHGLLLAGSGAAVGIVATFALRGVLGAMFPTSPGFDLGLYALVVPALLAVTLVAALVPALRASRIDPLVALRQD
jgi:macrolide transport system ATP-binding/permease protein